MGAGTWLLCLEPPLLGAWYKNNDPSTVFLIPGAGCGDSSQPRPNPPTFAQGVISEYGDGEECARKWLGGKRGLDPLTSVHFLSQMRLTSGSMRWLFHTQQLLQALKVLEGADRGAPQVPGKPCVPSSALPEGWPGEFPRLMLRKLKLVTEQQSKIQKQLDQVGKSDFNLATRNLGRRVAQVGSLRTDLP